MRWRNLLGYGLIMLLALLAVTFESEAGKVQRKKYEESGRGTAARKKYRESDRGKSKHSYPLYGILHSDKQAMYQAQAGKCSVCEEDFDIDSLGIDHDHHSGIVRGLLCSRCNVGIGYFRDDVKILAGAIRYLDENNFSFVHVRSG